MQRCASNCFILAWVTVALVNCFLKLWNTEVTSLEYIVSVQEQCKFLLIILHLIFIF